MVHDHDAAAEAVVRNRLYVLAAVVDHTHNQAAGAADNDDASKLLATLFHSYLLKNLILPLAHRSSAQNSTRRILPEQPNPLEFFSTKSLPFMPIL